MTKQNDLKKEYSRVRDEVLVELPRWKYTDKVNGFSLKEKGLFEGGTLLWGAREIILENDMFVLKGEEKRFRVPADDVLQFYVTREFEYYSGGKYHRSYYEAVFFLYIVLKSGKHIRVLKSENRDDLLSFEVFLERRLGLQDRTVLGEFQGEWEGPKIRYDTLPGEEAVVTEDIFCPRCKIALGASKENFTGGSYSCDSCGENFDCKYKEQKMRKNPLDKSLTCSVEGNELVIKRKHGFYASIGMIVTVGALLMLVFYPMFMDFFPTSGFTFPVIVLIATLTAAVVLSSNSTVIRISSDVISVRVEPCIFIMDRTYPSQGIEQIFVKRSNKANSKKYSLCALYGSGREMVLEHITGINTEKTVEILQAMEVMIEKRLGIEDKNVISESIG